MNSFYTEKELKEVGLKHFGNNVLISKKCSIYEAENISIGNNVRIDDFCILSGTIKIGNYVHISAYNALYGRYGITIGNFCGISPKSCLYSASDDFSGEYMVSPMVAQEYTNLKKGEIILQDYVQIGTYSTLMPGVICNQGSASGAYSFIIDNLDEWSIYAGIPAKKIKDRKKKIIEYAEKIEI